MASLTKEELKNALVSHGIDSPPMSAKKESFVALYEQHVAPTNMKEFSDDDGDDEIIISTKKATVYVANENDVDGDVVNGDIDLDSLDDDQLRQILMDNNIDAGPIVNSTRNLYKKKLMKILSGAVEDISIDDVNAYEDYSDTEPESAAENTADPVVDEPLDDTEPDSNHYSSEDDQPSGLSQPVPTDQSNRSKLYVTTSKDLDMSGSGELNGSFSSKNLNMSGSRELNGSIFSKNRNMNTSVDANGSVLRNRFGVDTPDSSLKFAPTARRSIHTYKVKEVTKQLTTRSKDGRETKNSTHTVEKSESYGDDDVPMAGSSKGGRWVVVAFKALLKLMLVGLFVAAAYYIYKNHLNKGEAIDQLQEAIQNAANKAAHAVGDALGENGGAAQTGGDTLGETGGADQTFGDVLGETGEAVTADVPADSMPKKPYLHV